MILATKILARLLIVSGPSYVQKFVDKTGGIVIMQHRLRRWWNIPTLWPICFAILFGTDVGTIDFSRTFDLFGLLEVFVSGSQLSVAYPAMIPVITSMLEQGLKAVTRDQSDPDSPLTERTNGRSSVNTVGLTTTAHRRQRSMTLEIGTSNTCKTYKICESLIAAADIRSDSQNFRNSTCRLCIHLANGHTISG